MARGPRRRRRSPDAGEPRSDDDVDLGAAEHAWWAQQDIRAIADRSAPDSAAPTQGSTDPPEPDDAPPARDILAEHLGEDWRRQFGFDRPGPVLAPRTYDTESRASPPPAAPPLEHEHTDRDATPIDTSDPYAVLGISSTATWAEIVDAHRSLARRHHPDHLYGHPPAEVELAEQRIRDINVAYQELRIRRGR